MSPGQRDRCEDCGRPVATEGDWKHLDEHDCTAGHCEFGGHLCWGECEPTSPAELREQLDEAHAENQQLRELIHNQHTDKDRTMVDELFPEDAEEAAIAAAKQDREIAAKVVRLREREADYTPRPVVRAVLGWYFANVLRISRWRPVDEGCQACTVLSAVELVEHTCPEPSMWLLSMRGGGIVSRPTEVIRVLDLLAGAGVWASEARRFFAQLGIPVEIWAVEIAGEEEVHLRRHADRVVIGDWREFAAQCKAEGLWFDLAIGNPAFSQARAPKVGDKFDADASMPGVMHDIAGATILYLTQQTWTKTASGFEVRRVYPPAFAVDIPGSVAHRAGVNPKTGRRWSADSIPYTASMWLGRIAGPHVGPTSTDMLEPFDGRSWNEELRPGAEPLAWLGSAGIPYLEVE